MACVPGSVSESSQAALSMWREGSEQGLGEQSLEEELGMAPAYFIPPASLRRSVRLCLVPGTGWERGSKFKQKNAPEVSEKRLLAPFFQCSQPDGRCKNLKSSHNHFGERFCGSNTVILSHLFVGQRTSLYHKIKHVSPSSSCFVTCLQK